VAFPVILTAKFFHENKFYIRKMDMDMRLGFTRDTNSVKWHQDIKETCPSAVTHFFEVHLS
jgi:hypothetical protein